MVVRVFFQFNYSNAVAKFEADSVGNTHTFRETLYVGDVEPSTAPGLHSRQKECTFAVNKELN